MGCNSSKFFVGQTINCTCSSDLQPTSFEWYQQDHSDPFCSKNITGYSLNFYGNSYVLVKPSTEEHGKLLICVTKTPYGSQNKSVTVDIESKLYVQFVWFC